MHLGIAREYIASARRHGTALLHDLLGEQPPAPALDRWRPDDAGDYCPRCGASIDVTAQTPRGCPFCVSRRLPWQRIIRLGAYAEPVQDWVLGAKFGGQWRWSLTLGEMLGRGVARSAVETQVAVCPVPMHWARRWRRGFNQAQLIARGFASVHGWPVAEVLRRVRYTRPQTAVASSRRRDNVRGSFGIAAVDLSGWTVWLVDDVKTTGATLGACAGLLRDAGARCVNAAVVAVADPHGGDFHRI
jgi:ComF family protein